MMTCLAELDRSTFCHGLGQCVQCSVCANTEWKKKKKDQVWFLFCYECIHSIADSQKNDEHVLDVVNFFLARKKYFDKIFYL